MMARYVSFESLMMTSRAVTRRGNWLRIQSAGDDPSFYWMEFDDKRTAKRAGASVLQWVREKRAAGKCNTDYMYNALLAEWINQLRRGGYIRNLRNEEEE